MILCTAIDRCQRIIEAVGRAGTLELRTGFVDAPVCELFGCNVSPTQWRRPEAWRAIGHMANTLCATIWLSGLLPGRGARASDTQLFNHTLEDRLFLVERFPPLVFLCLDDFLSQIGYIDFKARRAVLRSGSFEVE